VGEVTVTDVSSSGLGEVLEQVGRGDRRIVTRMRGKDGAEVSLTDPGHACRAGQGHLLRTDIDALRVKAIRLQQPDELTPPAANIDDGSGCGRRQQGTDVPPVNKSSRRLLTAACVL